jgi:hypothetical protein
MRKGNTTAVSSKELQIFLFRSSGMHFKLIDDGL